MTTTPADPDATRIVVEPKPKKPAARETDDAMLRHAILTRQRIKDRRSYPFDITKYGPGASE